MASLRCLNRALEARVFVNAFCNRWTEFGASRTASSPCTACAAGLGCRLPGGLPYSTPALCGPAPLKSGRSGTEPSLLNLRSCAYGERCLHTSTSLTTRKWERNNKKVYPPQEPGEPPRMAEVYYSRRQIKHSMRKMWYIATFVKGMMIDDALTQLQFINRKSAKIAREVLLEAQEEAVKNHNVEFKSNLHIAQSFVSKGEYDNAMRIHAKGRFSIMDLVYCHFFVCLKEGPPPKQVEATGYDQAQHYLDSLRKRTVTYSL